MNDNLVKYLGHSIYLIRGIRVMLDEDLAKIYGVETRILNQAIQRNKDRFPGDFMFKLTPEEYDTLKSQIVTSKSESINNALPDKESLISQIVISKRGGRRKKPFVFTEHGTVMLASVLRSKRAIQMNIEVVKTFVQLRRTLGSQKDVIRQLTEVRSFMLKQSNKTDREFRKVWKALDDLTVPAEDEAKEVIGFEIEKI